MIKKRSAFARIGATAVAASVIALTAGVGAANAEDSSLEFDLAHNGGTINFQFDSATLGDGYDVVVTSNALGYEAVTATNDSGLASATQFAGPVTVSIEASEEAETTDPEVTDPETTDPEVTDPETTDPEVTDPETTDPEVTDPETTDPEGTEPEGTEPDAAPAAVAAAATAAVDGIFTVDAAVWRGQTVTYAVTFDAEGEISVEAESVPVTSAPTLAELKDMKLNAKSVLSPGSYFEGEAFTAVFSSITDVNGDSLDGLALNTYMYSAPKAIHAGSIAAGTYSVPVAAEFTTAPHTMASFDNFGRLILAATLNGGATTDSPNEVLPPAVPAPGTNNNGLADTGAAENMALGLSAAAIMALGGALVARNLRLGRQS